MNIADLLPKLLETTKKKKLSWTQVLDKMFVARIGGRKFQIDQAFDEDTEQNFFRFNIYAGDNDTPYEGLLIDTMVADRYRGSYSDLEELYAEARRNALGLDKVISAIEDELDKLLK